MEIGPLKLGKRSGWNFIAEAINADIKDKKTIATEPLPAWVFENKRTAVHFAEGSYAPALKNNQPRTSLPVYYRQLYKDSIIGKK